MQQNKKSLLFPLIWILIFLSFISIILSLFIAISFSDSLNEENFTIEGFGIAKYNSTNNEFTITPLKNDAISSIKKQTFTKNFLKEYVTNRYTVSGNTINMQKTLGYQTPTVLNDGLMLKLPSYNGSNNDSILWTNAYIDFLKTDLPEIKELIDSNTTRSVRILSGPQKINDWWVLNVEFIYRNPTTYSLSIAKKEKYEIKLNISSQGIRPVEYINKNLPAGNVFTVKVIDIQKIKL